MATQVEEFYGHAQGLTAATWQRWGLRIIASALVLIAASLLIARITHSRTHLTVILACGAAYGMIPATASAIFFLAGRAPRAAVGAVGLATFFLVAQIPLLLPTAAATPAGVRLTIVSCNLRFGLADAGAITALVKRDSVDVLSLQELTPSAMERLRQAGLDHELPFSVTAAGPTAQGVGLWSRRPLLSSRELGGFSFHQVTAQLRVQGTSNTLNLFSTHMVAPWPGPVSTWAAELLRLHSILTATRGGLVDAGDFNATLDHQDFRSLLTGGLQDAARMVGSGSHPTFPADAPLPPVIAIDHAIVRGVTATSIATASIPGTDHRALVLRVTVPTTA